MSGSKVSLRELFLVFARIGAFSFGGGLTGWVYREVVQQRGWMSEREFASGMALSQILPGANITNLAVYVGQRLRGTAGASVCVIALLIVPLFAVVGFLEFYEVIAGVPWMARAISGVAAAAIGLLIFTTWRVGRHYARSIHGFIVVVGTYVAIGVFHLPLLPVVLCIAPLSVAAAWKWGKSNAA